ncbi:MAG: adenine phosphoribosyltransferase [Verrucomicrobia bacterium]|nr:adenine phosphoribosyltransferase [Verrucomicrobiota bacterium]
MSKIFKIVLASLYLGTSFSVFAENIKVVVTSKNEQKVLAVKKAFEDRFPNDEIELVSYKTASDIPEQPISEKTALEGVKNRLNNLPSEALDTASYIVSIENYIKQDPFSQKWQDIGLVLCKKRSDTVDSIFSTQATPIPDQFIYLAKELSSEISEKGYSCTVGYAISQYYQNKEIDSHNWHEEPQFGGVSRKELLEEALFKALHQEELFLLKENIVSYKDFPKPGILFDDFLPILNNPKSFSICIDLLYSRYKDKKIETIVGLESRGFLIGAALAYKLGVGFIPVRKPGKLPGKTYSITYEKEYGVDTLSIAANSIQKDERVLIIDDLIATGGSAKAAIELVRLAGGHPVEFVSLLEIKELGGRSKLNIPSFNLID